MGNADKIPRRANPKKKPCVDGETQRHSPTLMAAAVSKVLDDDDLLREIIVRVGFPTTLVRAALVCKRWLCHISDRKFLSRFRKLNPPRLLGFYIQVRSTPRFFPIMPQPPELAAVVRRVANHNFGGHKRLWLVDCKNGSVFTRHLEGGAVALGVYRPLCPETGLCIVPPFPTFQDHAHRILDRIVSKEEEGVLSYLYVLGEWTRETRNFRLRVYMLQDGVWCMHSSATEQLLHPLSLSASKVLLVGNKIYVADLSSGDILVLDLTAPSLSRIPLPQGLKCPLLNAAISRADDASSVYLTHVHVNKLVNVWLHKGDNWLLVHTICLREMWVNLRMQDHTFEDVQINFPYICEVGDNAECVLLKVYGWTLYLDVKSRTLCKVHGTAETNGITVIHPFKMIWPPTFPAVKADLARNAM